MAAKLPSWILIVACAALVVTLSMGVRQVSGLFLGPVGAGSRPLARRLRKGGGAAEPGVGTDPAGRRAPWPTATAVRH